MSGEHYKCSKCGNIHIAETDEISSYKCDRERKPLDDVFKKLMESFEIKSDRVIQETN